MRATLFLSIVSLAASVSGQVAVYQQCGGKNWSGGTTCVSGATCQVLNDYYSQCLPGTAAATTTTTTSKTSVTSSTSKASSSPVVTPASSTTVKPSSTVTNTAAQSTNSSVGKQIRTVSPPVYHLYLQDINGKPTLGPEATSGYFEVGSTVALIMANGSKLYLNVDLSGSASYKPFSFSTTATTTNWALSGDTFKVGNVQNLMVCPISGSTNYDLYLQTGSDLLSSSCTNYLTMNLPCLC